MQKEKLDVKKRDLVGKKVKKLRREGLIPANIYGKKISSLAVVVPEKEFLKIFRKAGETGLVELTIEGTKESRPVLIHNVQKHPVSGKIIHADFYQVDLTQKVKASISIAVKGEPKAVTEKKGVLLHILEEIEVESLPQDLPEHIEVNVESLAEVDQQIMVKDLVLDRAKVNILTKEDEIVFKIGALLTHEQEEELKAEEAKKAAEAAEKAAAEGGATAPAGEVAAKPEVKSEAPQEEKKE